MATRLAVPVVVAALLMHITLPGSVSGAPERWIETLSWEPRAFLYHRFLTLEEADHLVALAMPTIARSSVVDADTGAAKLDDIRTSYGTFLKKGEDPVVADIEERIAFWTKIPVANGEDIQVLRYQDGQKYDAHWDWFDKEEKHNLQSSGNRLATVLMYLSGSERPNHLHQQTGPRWWGMESRTHKGWTELSLNT